MDLFLTLVTALLLDSWLGEPRRFHPLVGFGRLARLLETALYFDSRLAGLVALLMLLVPFLLLSLLVDELPGGAGAIIEVLLLYFAIGRNSLGVHARRVQGALMAGDLKMARRWLGMLVSRDTAQLDRREVAGATLESVLENGNDAIFGAVFWFVVAGAPGAVIYRLANTLDAMWGYRNERYHRFGWAAARLDDLLNIVPARLTAVSYALAGRFRTAVGCWREQGGCWKSPNAGPVMAAGAGSLGISLGGAACYDGVREMRPQLGKGPSPDVDMIARGVRLVDRALLIWIGGLFAGVWLVG